MNEEILKAYGNYIIVRCEKGRSKTGIIFDASKNIGTVYSSNGELESGTLVVFNDSFNFTYKGQDYEALLENNIVAILEA